LQPRPPSASTSGAPIAPPPIKPFHRARAVNPLVKMADDIEYSGMEGAISVKARVLRSAPGSSSSTISPKMVEPSRARTSSDPNLTSQNSRQKHTSSLLTFQKGSLKTVKGKYSSLFGEQESGEPNGAQWTLPVDVSVSSMQPSVDGEGDLNGDAIPGLHDVEDTPSSTSQPAGPAPPQSAPTGQELLQLAGLDQQVADGLPDFEDPPTESSSTQTNQLTSESLHQQRSVHSARHSSIIIYLEQTRARQGKFISRCIVPCVRCYQPKLEKFHHFRPSVSRSMNPKSYC
jgi:hypothetical protein